MGLFDFLSSDSDDDSGESFEESLGGEDPSTVQTTVEQDQAAASQTLIDDPRSTEQRRRIASGGGGGGSSGGGVSQQLLEQATERASAVQEQGLSLRERFQASQGGREIGTVFTTSQESSFQPEDRKKRLERGIEKHQERGDVVREGIRDISTDISEIFHPEDRKQRLERERLEKKGEKLKRDIERFNQRFGDRELTESEFQKAQREKASLEKRAGTFLKTQESISKKQLKQRQKRERESPLGVGVASFGAGFVRSPFTLADLGVGLATRPGSTLKETFEGFKEIPSDFAATPIRTTGELTGEIVGQSLVFKGVAKSGRGFKKTFSKNIESFLREPIELRKTKATPLDKSFIEGTDRVRVTFKESVLPENLRGFFEFEVEKGKGGEGVRRAKERTAVQEASLDFLERAAKETKLRKILKEAGKDPRAEALRKVKKKEGSEGVRRARDVVKFEFVAKELDLKARPGQRLIQKQKVKQKKKQKLKLKLKTKKLPKIRKLALKKVSKTKPRQPRLIGIPRAVGGRGLTEAQIQSQTLKAQRLRLKQKTKQESIQNQLQKQDQRLRNDLRQTSKFKFKQRTRLRPRLLSRTRQRSLQKVGQPQLIKPKLNIRPLQKVTPRIAQRERVKLRSPTRLELERPLLKKPPIRRRRTAKGKRKRKRKGTFRDDLLITPGFTAKTLKITKRLRTGEDILKEATRTDVGIRAIPVLNKKGGGNILNAIP